jgi:serine/threonine-protein kinase RsbW
LVLKKDMRDLARLTAFLRDIGRKEKLGEKQIFVLELCLEEAVVNIVKHGEFPQSSDGRIFVSIARATPFLVACIEDTAAPFDPTCAPPPPSTGSLETTPIGGLGIHLIRQLATNIHYDRREGRNHLRLEFRLNGEKPSGS